MILSENDNKKLLRKKLRISLLQVFVICSLIVVTFIIESSEVSAFEFQKLGILPRHTAGLKGVLFMPLLHVSFSHLLSNVLALMILLSLLFYFYSPIAYRALTFMWFGSGFLTWIIGRGVYHIGASALVFSLVFFIFFSGIFRHYLPLIAVSLVIVFLYGSTLWSMFPVAEYIDITLSWEGHLAGAISGLMAAIVYRHKAPLKPVVEWDEDDTEIKNGVQEEEEIMDDTLF